MRIDSLQSLRFVLIFMVVWAHSMLPQPQVLHDFLGEFPVSAFFVLSGFVLSLDKGKRLASGETKAGVFFLSCVRKVFPLHLLVLGVTLLLDWRLGIVHPVGSVVAHALLLQSWSTADVLDGVLNAPSWFLSDILFFYLVYAALYRWQARRRWSAVLPFTLFYSAGYLLLAVNERTDCSAGYIYAHPLFRIIDFFMGILLCRVYRRVGIRFPVGMPALKAHVADCVALLLLAVLYGVSAVCAPNIRCAALYWVPSSALILYVACADGGAGWMHRLLGSKALVWLGGISFEMYLCHNLCIRLVQSLSLRLSGGGVPCPGAEFVAVVLLTVLVSWTAKKAISHCLRVCETYII